MAINNRAEPTTIKSLALGWKNDPTKSTIKLIIRPLLARIIAACVREKGSKPYMRSSSLREDSKTDPLVLTFTNQMAIEVTASAKTPEPIMISKERVRAIRKNTKKKDAKITTTASRILFQDLKK